MIAERYPREAWVYVFTDESATSSVTNGVAGILVHFQGGQKATVSMAVGRHCSNYREETEALMQAASIVQASDHDCKQIVSLSDALSVLQAYQNHMFPNLTKALQQVGAIKRAVLQRIPAHCGISGNEQANILEMRVLDLNSMTTVSVSGKRRLSLERSRCQSHKWMTIICLSVGSNLFW